MKALVIPADLDNRAVHTVEYDGGLQHLKEIVGGYIEGVPVPGHTAHMYVNEDGHRLGLPHNGLASVLTGQPIVGDVVVLGNGRLPDEDDVPDSLLARFGLGA